MFGPLKPAPHIAELPAEKIDSTYKRLRWQVFAGIFFGYAAYYFVRANFDLAQPGLIQAGLYSKAELGVIGSAAGLAYGLSKFVMAGMSDRSNPRVFLPFGLLLSGLCMTLIGFLIYGPVMLIGLHALELAPKKAAGTAAGFTGLFGYLGGTVSASAVIGWAAQHYGWDGGFYVMIGGGVLAVLLLLIVMVEEGKHKAKLGDTYGTK